MCFSLVSRSHSVVPHLAVNLIHRPRYLNLARDKSACFPSPLISDPHARPSRSASPSSSRHARPRIDLLPPRHTLRAPRRPAPCPCARSPIRLGPSPHFPVRTSSSLPSWPDARSTDHLELVSRHRDDTSDLADRLARLRAPARGGDPEAGRPRRVPVGFKGVEELEAAAEKDDEEVRVALRSAERAGRADGEEAWTRGRRSSGSCARWRRRRGGLARLRRRCVALRTGVALGTVSLTVGGAGRRSRARSSRTTRPTSWCVVSLVVSGPAR